jgi:uncharacterized protein YkwD
MRVVLVVLLCCVGIGPAQAGLSHQNWFHLPAPQRVYGSGELALRSQLRSWYRRHQVKAPVSDHGLRYAAWLLASMLYKQKTRSLTHQTVSSALWLGGRTDRKIHLFARSYTNASAMWRFLRLRLARKIGGQRHTAMGLAVVGGTRKLCVILFARRGARVDALPRWSIKGQRIWIRGQLAKSFRKPGVAIGLPNGMVVQLKPKLLANRRFEVSWAVPVTGRIRIQVIVRDDEGPWISSQSIVEVFPQHATIGQKVRGLWKSHRQHVGLVSGSRPKPKPRGRVRWFSSSLTPGGFEQAMLKQINALRRKRKLPVFRRHSRLDQMARNHSTDMVKEHFFAHTSPQHGSFRERFLRLGWKVYAARENIVVGKSPKDALRLLFQSPIHRINLLLPRVYRVGVGAYRHPSGSWYVTQVFVVTKDMVPKKKKSKWVY